MWSVAITSGATELQVRDRLSAMGFQVFCPYTVEKTRVKVAVPRTKSNPNPRTVFKVVETETPRWPRYLFVRTPTDDHIATVQADKDVRALVKGSEGIPSSLPDYIIARLRVGCLPCGRLSKTSELLRIVVDDVLQFVAPSPELLALAKKYRPDT